MTAAATLVLLAAVTLASCTSLPARSAARADVSRSHQHPSAPVAAEARAAGTAGDAAAAAAATAAAAPIAHLLAADGGDSCAGLPTAQTMTGAVSGCIRIPDVSPGAYHLVIEQVLVTPAAPRAKPAYGGEAVPPPRASAGPPGPPVQLSVITRHPRPGGDLVILGTVTGARPPDASTPNLCLDGCTGGLVYDGVPVQWTSRTRFMLRIVLPATGWLAASSGRVRTLDPGDNTLSLTCLAPERGCAGAPPEGSATFRLASTPSRCAAAQPCSVLAVDPAVATPGRVVGVAGFAPLVSVIGSDEPFVYQLALLPGSGSGEPTRFVGNAAQGVLRLDASTVELGAAAVTVAPAPSLASLGVLHPLLATADGPSGAGPVTPDPTDPSAVAWCGTGSLTVASTGSGPAVSVPTGAASAALDALGTPGPTGIPPQCVAAVPLGPASDPAGVVAAAFPTLPADQSPMVADVALSTSNGGQSWTPLPVPAGVSPDGFGGFRVDSGTLLALYPPSPARPAATPLVEADHAPGTAWAPSRLGCPADGPCVTFAAYQPGACAMNGTLQGLLSSPDGGRTWATPSWPAAVDACSRAELVATSPTSELLLDPGSQFPVRRSVDGGISWSALSVPSLPGVPPGTAPTPGDGSLLLLPNGSLLLTGEHGSSSAWELLRPDATRWCSVTNAPRGAAAATAFAPVELLGGQLWWLPGRPGTAQQDAQHVVADALRC